MLSMGLHLTSESTTRQTGRQERATNAAEAARFRGADMWMRAHIPAARAGDAHATATIAAKERLIPRLVDQDPWAQLRRPMDMIRQG